MRRKTCLPELLAPAGSLDAFYAAINAGADAVYLGVSDFNARRFADNLNEETLKAAVAYAHLFDKRVYVTLNTLVTDKEIPDFLRTAAYIRESGADAVIVADIGAATLLNRYFPDLPLHASTQMSIHSACGADEAASLGVTRVVPARELSLPDICSIVKNAATEVEVFLHGALCVSHSGQCLMSAMIGGRSGNRGECAQPCRLPYHNGYPLSLRDLSLASHIKELIASGVASLKIEGRMKSPEYVYTVTKIYRRLLDEERKANEKELRTLADAFSRNGFTDGYFVGRTEKGMTGIRSDEDKEKSRSLSADITPKRHPLLAIASIKSNENVKLTLQLKGKEKMASATLPPPDAAKSAPLSASSVLERLARLGATPFSLSEEDVTLSLDDGLFLTPAALNGIRRECTDVLLSDARPPLAYEYTPSPKETESTVTSALFFSPAQMHAAEDFFDERYLPLWLLKECEETPEGVWLPPVVTDKEEAAVRGMLLLAKERGVRLALISGIGQIALAREYGLTPVGDFRLNICNRESYAAYKNKGVSSSVLSAELTLPQCRDIGGRVIVYGRIPLMLLERCFITEGFGCDRCDSASLTDRRGASFPLMRIYPHRNLLLNSLPTYVGERKDDLRRFSLGAHFIFTLESDSEVRNVIKHYKNGEKLPFMTRGIGRSRSPEEKERKG